MNLSGKVMLNNQFYFSLVYIPLVLVLHFLCTSIESKRKIHVSLAEMEPAYLSDVSRSVLGVTQT